MTTNQNDLQAIAKALFQSAVDRADPAKAVQAALASEPLPPLAAGGRNFILAAGKAAVPMMKAALQAVPDPAQALVITNPENKVPVQGAEVLCGAHPVPDANSEKAGAAAFDLVAEVGPKDRLLVLVSGGASALMVLPAPGLTLSDKASVNKLLLGAGLEINQMNLIRQQLSLLKGGGLAQAAAPAEVRAYILSDVIGDDLRAIASGPTVSPIGTRADAKALLQDAGLWQSVPQSVQDHLNKPNPLEVKTPAATNTLIGSNRQSLAAMLAAVPAGFEAKIVTDSLTGDVGAAADYIVNAAREAPADRPVALLFGGETTVEIKGNGRGGRNQELALRVAREAKNLSGNWVFLSGGTDGRDGPTDAAGGIVTADTWKAIKRAGSDPAALLANNDSNAALACADALLVTGGTGTNVADVQVFLHVPD